MSQHDTAQYEIIEFRQGAYLDGSGYVKQRRDQARLQAWPITRLSTEQIERDFQAANLRRSLLTPIESQHEPQR